MTINDEQRSVLEQATSDVDQAKAAFDAAKLERERLIHQIALSGASYREIAQAAGISYQRVHQLLTGEKPPQMPWQIHELFTCPKCEAKPRHACVKPSGYAHQERHYRAYDVFFGGADPLPGEPGLGSELFHAMETYGPGWREKGPIYLTRDDAEAYVDTLAAGSYVARWAGRKWERIK
jgi:hypothetical protein